MRRHSNISKALVASLTMGGGICAGITANAQIAVIDDNNLTKRNEDENQNAESKKTKADEQVKRKSVVCTFSNKYRNEMFRRSPADALKRDASNVSMIRYYAKKYNVPEGLALSVSYQEARFDTCAGSHTGVKGVMQLTKGTANGMGFDRDINEQNIEGGVKYLGMGVKRCGSTNYACLAKWYNGSTANEQRGWAAGVARYHGYFNEYVGSGAAPAALPPQVSISTVGGAGGRAQSGGVSTANSVGNGLSYSHTQMIANGNAIDAIQAGVGATEDYKDAWEDNSRARGLNIAVFNEAIKSAVALNEILNAKRQLTNTHMSQAAKMVSKPKSTVNPFSCDPAALAEMKLPYESWSQCAKDAWAASGGEASQTNAFMPNAAGAAMNVKNLQVD